jgi:hypothetical protein
MFIRKAAFEVLELWSESGELAEIVGDWVIDWRWLATGNEDRERNEPSFTSECALIH